MDNKNEIHEVLIKYLKAFYTKNYDEIFSNLYETDLIEYKKLIIDFSEKMDYFGESTDFFKKINVKSLNELKLLTLREFSTSIFKMLVQEVGSNQLNKIINETTIIEIDEASFISNVKYEFPIMIGENLKIHRGEIQMIKSKGEWKILFKPGFENGFKRYEDEINIYFERKSKDNLLNLVRVDYIEKFSLTGYKNCVTEKVIIEPRFKDAGEFEEGLAYVKIMKKYGYINLKGEMAIKPQFLCAKDFSEKLASVKIKNIEGKEVWGFINKKGEMVIEPVYKKTLNFKSGMCGVKLNKKWGYIDKNGVLIIPCLYDYVHDFSYGSADVQIYNNGNENDSTGYTIDKTGKIKSTYEIYNG